MTAESTPSTADQWPALDPARVQAAQLAGNILSHRPLMGTPVRPEPWQVTYLADWLLGIVNDDDDEDPPAGEDSAEDEWVAWDADESEAAGVEPGQSATSDPGQIVDRTVP